METAPLSLFIAFSAGFLSFVSPCVLPLIPSYLSYITGLSFNEMVASEGKTKEVMTRNALAFILGFSTVFILFGVSATFIGRFFLSHQAQIRQGGAVVIILFGLYTLGILKPAFLSRDARVRFQNKPAGLVGSFLIGIAFGAGWTPCVGPILGSILLYASTTGSIWTGAKLLVAYSLGLGLPFFVASMGIQAFFAHSKKATQYMRTISLCSGFFLVVVGVLLFTNSLTRLTTFLSEVGIGWTVGQ